MFIRDCTVGSFIVPDKPSSKAEQSKAKQSKAKQSKAKQSKTKQTNPLTNIMEQILLNLLFSFRL
jgi:hypothetical protein